MTLIKEILQQMKTTTGKKKTSKMQLLSPVLMDTPTIQLLNLTIETTEITSFYIGPSMHPSIHVFIHPSRQPKVLFNFSL